MVFLRFPGLSPAWLRLVKSVYWSPSPPLGLDAGSLLAPSLLPLVE